jgi:hypothetical protein
LVNTVINEYGDTDDTTEDTLFAFVWQVRRLLPSLCAYRAFRVCGPWCSAYHNRAVPRIVRIHADPTGGSGEAPSPLRDAVATCAVGNFPVATNEIFFVRTNNNKWKANGREFDELTPDIIEFGLEEVKKEIEKDGS